MIGSGYVSLVSGASFLDFGHTVACVDRGEAKVAALRAGAMPIYEPGLKALVDRNVRQGRLNFSPDLAAAIDGVDAVFIAVGSPSRHGDGHADMSYVCAPAADVARAAKSPLVLVTKSPVLVSTGDKVERICRELRPGLDLHVSSKTEFLREGAAIDDFKRPDRVVLGAESARARGIMDAIYQPLYLNNNPVVLVSPRTLELIKYVANAFLTVKITSINEMADLCEETDPDWQDLTRGMGLDGRISSELLHTGQGYGGWYFPKDTLLLVKRGGRLRGALTHRRNGRGGQRRAQAGDGAAYRAGVRGSVRGKRIALLELALKLNTEDLRETPSLAIVAALRDAGGSVRGYDTEGQARLLMPEVEFAPKAYVGVEGANAVAT